jgi:NAD(P)-dependent dehydrogenase (short-subunit alcohol dehydrogenase family)
MKDSAVALIKLDGKAAFVTGGARGVGFASASLFAARGASPSIADPTKRREPRAAEAIYLKAEFVSGASFAVGGAVTCR